MKTSFGSLATLQNPEDMGEKNATRLCDFFNAQRIVIPVKCRDEKRQTHVRYTLGANNHGSIMVSYMDRTIGLDFTKPEHGFALHRLVLITNGKVWKNLTEDQIDFQVWLDGHETELNLTLAYDKSIPMLTETTSVMLQRLEMCVSTLAACSLLVHTSGECAVHQKFTPALKVFEAEQGKIIPTEHGVHIQFPSWLKSGKLDLVQDQPGKRHFTVPIISGEAHIVRDELINQSFVFGIPISINIDPLSQCTFVDSSTLE